jgi:hypothetical protein
LFAPAFAEEIESRYGRILNPGYALVAAWFILHEARLRKDEAMRKIGLTALD